MIQSLTNSLAGHPKYIFSTVVIDKRAVERLTRSVQMRLIRLIKDIAYFTGRVTVRLAGASCPQHIIKPTLYRLACKIRQYCIISQVTF